MKSVYYAILEKDGKVLLMQRHQDSSRYPCMFTFIGGKAPEGLTRFDAIREICQRKAHISLISADFVGYTEDADTDFWVYMGAEWKSDELIKKDNVLSLVWYDGKNLKSGHLTPVTQSIYSRYRENKEKWQKKRKSQKG